mgnify:CR=1 FL=1|jgi:dihydroneopterin aldolase
MDKIFIEGLKVECIIGILPYEREHTQTLIIDISLEHDLTLAGIKHDLSLSIDYAALASRVEAYVIERKAELLEELGVELCDLILKEFKPQKVTLKLNKPQAVKAATGAGIEVSKTLR